MGPTTPRAPCCTARDPPSPDGLPPRPAQTPSSKEPNKNISLDHHGKSWTSADVTELQAIFEDELLADISTNAIKLTRIRIGTDDDNLFDPIDDGSEVDVYELQSKRSSHTLRAVTEKLKKHLNIDSAIAKRHSRSSLRAASSLGGDEEVERRAELRRIRQKRIAEELSQESIYDDDAREVASLLGVGSDAGKKEGVQSEVIATPLAELEAQEELSHQFLELTEKAPVILDETCSSTAKSLEGKTDFIDMSTSPTLVNSDGSVGQDHHSPAHSPTESDHNGLKVYVPTSMASLILKKPASELSSTKHRSSASGSESLAKSLWRSSFSSDHRREGLRALSQGSGIPVVQETTEPTANISNSPYGAGLISGRHDGTLTSARKDALGTAESHRQNCCGSHDFGGVDGGTDEAIIPHLPEMGISQRLASSRLQSSISSPQLSSWGSRTQGQPSSANTNTTDITRRGQYTDDLIASIDGNLGVWSQIKLDKLLFRPKSAAPDTNNRQPVLNSRFSFSSYLPSSKARAKYKFSSSAEEEFVECLEQPEEENGGRAMTPEPPALTNIIPATPGAEGEEQHEPIFAVSFSPALLSQNDISLGHSVASSFMEREQELETLQVRFAERRVLSTPVSSKFREEFDRPARPVRKASVLVRLARLARRSIEGTGDGTVDRSDLLMVPIPAFDPSALMTPGSPMLDDAEVFWGNAGKKSKGKEVDRDQKKGLFGRKKSAVGGAKKKGLHLFGKKKELTAAELYQQQLDEQMGVQELVMDSWEMEMEATAAKAKTKSRNIVKKDKPARPDYRFPASWARFSSHDREERASSATSVEKVDVKDFANLGVKENGDVIWCLAHDDEGHHTTIDGLHRKKPLGERFILAVNKELYEFDTQDDQRAQTNGRRGSLTVALETEYPELEILPLQMMGHEEIKKQEAKKEIFEEKMAKDEELDEIAKLLGGGFDGAESKGVTRHATAMEEFGGEVDVRSVAGASDWEDEMAMSVSSDALSRRGYAGLSGDPEYYADCIAMTKSTFASTVGSPVGTPGGTMRLRTDMLDEMLSIPASEQEEFDYERWRGTKWPKRDRSKKSWSGSGEGGTFEGFGSGVDVGVGSGMAVVGSGGERKKSLGTMLMSKSISAADMRVEMKRREGEEREGLLRAVEDAFGRGE